MLAERARFELAVPFRVRPLSRRVPSTTRPPLRLRLNGSQSGHCERILALPDCTRVEAESEPRLGLWATAPIESSSEAIPLQWLASILISRAEPCFGRSTERSSLFRVSRRKKGLTVGSISAARNVTFTAAAPERHGRSGHREGRFFDLADASRLESTFL